MGMAMMDLLITDLDKEMTEATTQEKDSQADYEKMMRESASKRRIDSGTLTEKTGVKADLGAALQKTSEEKVSASKELMATAKYRQSLHSECDWLLQYFDARKQARAGEAESLKRAKAVLSGADFSLLQSSRRAFLGHQK